MTTVPTLCATGSIVGAAGIGYAFGHARGETSISYFPSTETEEENTRAGDPGNLFQRPERTSPSAEASLDTLQRHPSRLKQFASLRFSRNSSPAETAGSTSGTFSSGSSVPFIHPERPVSARPPNKLIKRSHSQHLSHRELGSEGVNTSQILNRPATSHKRLATLSRHPSTNDGNKIFARRPPAVFKPYKSFFRVKVPKGWSSTTLRNARDSDHPWQLRRIYPTSADQPVLVAANSISLQAVEVDASLPRENDVFSFGSRPNTPSGIRHFFNFSGPPASLQTPEPTSTQQSRISFSIGDLLSRPPPTDRTVGSARSSKGRRITSAPRISMHNGQSPLMADKQPKRRDVGASKARRSSGQRVDAGAAAEHFSTPSRTEQGSQRSHRSQAYSKSPTTKKESPTSNVFTSSMSQPSPQSATPSDNASSQLGSDLDAKVFSSGDEDDGDKQSDSVYDSLRTGATRSSSGFRGPALETLFDKAPTTDIISNVTSASNADLQHGAPSSFRTTMEEDGSLSTPPRTVIPDKQESRRSSENNASRTPVPGSVPPQLPEPLSLGELDWDSDLGDDEYSWSDEDFENGLDEKHVSNRLRSGVSHETSSDLPLPPFRPQRSGVDHEQRYTLFDWSEQQPTQVGVEDRPPPRPKTVHGKKEPGGRSSRATARHAPSGLHARSKSVPALADLPGNRNSITSKFGTWGVGSKGVTEDWNEDFEFDEDLPIRVQRAVDDERRENMPAPGLVVVPDSIKAQQTNVLANIGLLKEWGLLIEELKELRERAISLNLESDRHAQVFDEVDAMINLADQEAADESVSNYRSSSQSPATDLASTEPQRWSPVPKSKLGSQDADDVFGPMPSASVATNSVSAQTPEKEAPLPATRPRKDSEAVAQTVIRAIQTRGKTSSSSESPRTPARKVPFDTTTLRHIVPYVHGLSKKMKQVLRDAEGLHSSPKHREETPEPLLRQAFIEPEQDDLPTTISHSQRDDYNDDQDERHLTSQMTSMTIRE